MTPDYDVNEPILILVRRGRGGRGYLVAAVDDAANPFPCVDDVEIGKAVIELLDDPKQPRFDERQLEDLDDNEEELEGEAEAEGDDDGDEEEVSEESEPEIDPLDELGLDPGEKLAFKLGGMLLDKARHLSNDYRHKKKKKKRTKKARR